MTTKNWKATKKSETQMATNKKNNQKMRKANGRKQKIANNDPETAKKYQSTWQTNDRKKTT